MSSYPPPLLKTNEPLTEFNAEHFKDNTDGNLNEDQLTVVPPLFDGGVTYYKSDHQLHTKNNLIFDDTNNRLGINTATPSTSLHVVGNSTLGGDTSVTNNLTVTGSVAANSTLSVGGLATLFKTNVKSLTFDSLTTNGAINSCSKTSEYPLVVQTLNNISDGSVTQSAIAFSANSNSNSVAEADIAFTRLADGPARGKLNINLVTGTVNKETVMSFQGDRTLITKNVGINQAAPLSALHVGGDAIVNNLAIGTGAVPTSKLTFPAGAENKINLNSGTAGSLYGIGLNNTNFNFHVPSTNSYFQWQSGGTNGDGTLRMMLSNIGLGIATAGAPSHTLHLGTDDAFKQTTPSWTNPSDRRLKENIETVDYDLCYNNIKQLELRRFRWKDIVETVDRNVTGWIADEIEPLFPKAIRLTNMYGIEDIKAVQSDEINKALYGTVKKLIKMVEQLQIDNETMKAEISELKKLAF